MKKKLYLLFLMLLPGISFAQNCIQSFDSNCWFNGVYAVRSSSDGAKFFAVGGTGPAGNSNATTCTTTNTTIKVYDVTASGIVYNAAQSVTPGGSAVFSDFVANNGYFYSNGTTVSFKEASGTAHTVGTYSGVTQFEKVAGAPNKMIVRVGSSHNQAVILDASNPAAPSATTVTLPGGSLASAGSVRYLAVADETENRIYYVTTENEAGSIDAPYYRYKIKACTMTGGAVAGWTDVVLQRGTPIEMAVRPTDRRLFIRTYKTDYHLDFHGLVVINKDGSLPTDMNMSDLSLLGGPAGTGSGTYRDLAFDSDGNIYANMWNHINGPTVNVMPNGIMKFDPQGNLDMGFMRNVWNSYAQSSGAGTNSFDITDGGVIVKSTYGTANAYEDHYALSLDHVNANNEDPNNTYSSIPASIANWGVYPVFDPGGLGNGTASKYRNVQFLFNNGKLIRPGASASDITQNCGISTPQIVPPAPSPASGTINCAKTAFISAPKAGTPASIAIRVEVNVTGVGTFSPITISGSGFSLLDSDYTITANATGLQSFVIPAQYDGSALSSVDIGVGQAGTCTADLSTLPTDTKRVEIEIWTPENCTFKQVGPSLK